MRVTSHFKFDASGRLVVHEDVWSLRELVAYTAGGALGVLYDALRDVNGRVSAFAMDHVLWMVGGARKTLFGVPKRTFSGIGFGLNLGGGSYSRNGKGT
ncbi:hypothetical protein BC830DRAFT_387182 [Chytriomyces sp. MP71]|nr:hypothetical protein BC830DRAFT_387182 [Chytriomyces sp. MP71]